MQSTSNVLIAPGTRSEDRMNASSQLQLQLPSITNSKGYQFPTIYSFPPFFTHQPNPTTWSHQLKQWTELILSYCRYHRIFSLSLTSLTCSIDLFSNNSISRKLSLETLREIIEDMVISNIAAYDPPRLNPKVLPTEALIYWRTPEEWGEIIYAWIDSNGLTNSIMTFYELTIGGDLAESTDFFELPIPLLRKALDTLIKKGKAQVFTGTEGEDGDGVKFM